MATEVVVNIIISIAVLDAICIVLVQGLVRNGFDVDFKGDLGGETLGCNWCNPPTMGFFLGFLGIN